MSMHDEDFDDIPPARRDKGIADADSVDLEDAPIKIRAFLEKVLKDPDTQEEVEVVLFHSKAGDDKNIDGYTLGFEENLEDLIKEICDDVIDFLIDNHFKAKNTFFLRLKDRPKPKMQFKVRVISKFAANANFDEYEGEAPTGKGQIAQNMRHTEVAYHTLINGVQITQASLAETNQELRSEAAVLRRENREMVRERQEVLDMQFKRNLEYEEMQREQERKDKMLAGVVAAAMSIIEMIFRNKGEREALSMLQMFFNGLSPEHKMGVFAAIPQNKQSELVDILNKMQTPNAGPSGGPMEMIGTFMQNFAAQGGMGGPPQDQGPSGPQFGPPAASPPPGQGRAA